jgi:hypothetical protein
MQRCRMAVGSRGWTIDAGDVTSLDGRAAELPVIGSGGISATLRWQDGLVLKPLPDFPHQAAVEAYAAAVDAHVRALEQAGVEALPAAVEAFARPGGTWAACIVQPEIPAAQLLPECLRASGRKDALRLLDQLAAHIESAVNDRIGLDADITNWCVQDGRLALLDISTPMLRDTRRRLAFDPVLFMGGVPRLLRPVLKRYVEIRLVRRFFERRRLFIDVLSGFRSERLQELLPPAIERVNRNTTPRITECDVERYRRRNERFWRTLARLQGKIKGPDDAGSNEARGKDRESNPIVRPDPS